MTSFKQNVLKIVSQIPHGKVASYGQIALLADSPRSARQVGWILFASGPDPKNRNDLPWWRVVNNSGRISIKNPQVSPHEQKERLEAEGIKINDDFTFEIEKYRWLPDEM